MDENRDLVRESEKLLEAVQRTDKNLDERFNKTDKLKRSRRKSTVYPRISDERFQALIKKIDKWIEQSKRKNN